MCSTRQLSNVTSVIISSHAYYRLFRLRAVVPHTGSKEVGTHSPIICRICNSYLQYMTSKFFKKLSPLCSRLVT